MTHSSTAVAPEAGSGSGRIGHQADSDQGPGAAGLAGRLARLDWLWAALLTLAIGLVGIGKAEPWRDELASWSAATRSTGDLFELLGHVDAVSGLYYLVLHGWISVAGDSTAMIRVPSAVAMAAAAAFAVLTARKVFDRRTAVFAGLLFAFLPTVSRYAQEARSYAFVVAAVAAATWLLLRALERPGVRRWAPYALAITLAGLFHIVSLLVLFPHLVIVLMRWRAQARPRPARTVVGFVVTGIVALLPIVPLVLLGRAQVGRQIGTWLKAPHLRTIADVWNGLYGSPLVALGILAAALLPLAWSRGRRPAVELMVVGLHPLAAAWLVSQGSSSYFLDRYLLFTMPAWIVLAAAGLAALRPRTVGALGLAALILLGATDLRQMRTVNSKGGADGKAAAAVIAKGYKPGDGFVPVRGADRVFMIDFQVEYYLPERVELRDVFAERSAVASDDLFPVECPQPTACLGTTQRVWVVTWSGTSNPYHKLPKEQEEALRSHFKVVEMKKVRGLEVSLLERVK